MKFYNSYVHHEVDGMETTIKPDRFMSTNEISEIKDNVFKNSLIMAFSYVWLGTIAAMSVYNPESPLYGDWIYGGLLLTLPASIFGVAIMYADPNGYLLVLLVETVIFFLFWLMLYRYLLKRSTARNAHRSET